MPSEQKQFFCIQKTNLLQDDESDRLCVPTSDISIEKSTFEPTISDILAYGLKNVKVELPRVNIPNEVIFKHEIDKYMKLFQCKEKPVEVSFIQMDMNGSSSEIYTPHNKPGLHYEEGLKTSAKILNFSCTKCQNNIRYSPNDLQKHFQLLHQGELPSYPCEMCNFSANDFQSFNQHRRTHRSTLVKCEICNDDHRYTLLDLTKHFTSKHCVNGHFQCERCRFSTQDVGTFVQHIHRHNEIQYNCEKCHHVSFSKEEFQKHVVSHTGTFPFSCQYCNYMASRKNYLLKHIITLHRDHLYAKDKMDTDDNEKRVKTSTGLKLILKRYKTGASRKALWRRKKITTDGCRTEEEDEHILKDMKESPPKSEELGQSVKELHLHDILLNEKHVYSGTRSSSAIQYNRAEGGLGSARGLMKKAVHGPTVLMVKNNKISVPANYSAKFMGFKMVDGKQHIVIKLLPTDKQNLPGGNKVDGIKDGTTECQQEIADNCNLPSVPGSHEINNQMPRNHSVHSLTSPLSNQFSKKIKQEGKNMLCCNTSQNIVPPIVVVGKCATHLPVKPETSSVPCDLVVKARSPVSWKNCIPQDHPQILPSSGSRMLHYDPMKKSFPPEFRVVNGEINSSKHSNLYCPSADFSNQAPLPFHNYSKIGILEKSKELTSNKIYPLQSKPINETLPCFSQSVTGLNLDKKSSLLPLYGFVNGNNAPVFSASPPSYSIDKQCWIENHRDGQLYLNSKVNQVLEHVAEKSKLENDSNCVNSSLMPKITSVFSLHSKQASTYLSPEVNQSLQDVLKGPITQSNNYIKTNYDQPFSNKYTNCKTFTHFTDSSAWCNLTDPSDKFKRELNMNNTATNESVYLRNEGQIPVPLRMEAIHSASRKTGVGALLKTQTDSIITQQLAKDKVRYNIHGPNKICPTFPEQKKTVLQSTPPRFFVPLQLAQKQGLQVISGKPPPKVSSSDVQATRTAPTSLLLNKGPGMILTFGRGSLGTAANATENNSQVLEKFASKEAVSSEMNLQTNDARSLRNSSINMCSGAGNASSIAIPQNEQLSITNSESRLSSVKILAGFQGSKAACVESVKQPEVGQEQPVYALLPNGRQAVFLKCMSPNKSLVQNHNIFQGPTHSQSSEPKKHGAMQQKLFLKIKTFPAADKCQPVSNVVSSLQLDTMKCCNSPALNQKNTALSSSNALLLPGSLMPANACSANDKSKDSCSSAELVHSSRDGRTWSQKIPTDSTQKGTANKGNSFENQTATENMTTKITKVKRHSKQNDAKVSNATVSQKNRNLKRKTKDDFQGPPRKKTLHRKCKEKNQVDVNEFESLFQAPYRPRVSKDTIRILNLLPFNSKQLVKCPRRNQPVVVLNHPDADVPEVVNVMKTIAKFKGHVLKVSLSKRTIDALLEPAYYSNSLYLITNELTRRKRKMLKPVSPVKERFVLKLTLKKTSKNNYQIVKTTSDNTLKTKFSCWFCGRIFDNQDNWVGHGQRHLMEATRDWNSLE
ncbi:zinc finger protein 518A [Python bivittatus]|uniref:Zinc finger protein 518A n=1 Tax=Python bivittatus TaxID=176946 RepID=A0A9F3QR29_PYTBI|nr:zinc finger protein 518A [Python bivittatus]XP_025019961.1 zinc finger protein 518A [Python bivittatus]